MFHDAGHIRTGSATIARSGNEVGRRTVMKASRAEQVSPMSGRQSHRSGETQGTGGPVQAVNLAAAVFFAGADRTAAVMARAWRQPLPPRYRRPNACWPRRSGSSCKRVSMP
ncbi:hypothetical protein NMD1_02785 [Novosphingobium sp. MD-1]|nr:hypothetical protein NMD1_02785 [Novosphingobium sp. MD-1]